jgi:ABC-2 type transport system permease protein
MRLWYVFVKTLREQLRSGWDLIISIALAPMFVFMYWLFIGSSSSMVFPVLIVDQDQTACVDNICVQQAVQSLKEIHYGSNSPMLRLQEVADVKSGEAMLRKREAVALITFPAGYAAGLRQVRDRGGAMPVAIQISGDLTHPYYPLAGVMISSALSQYAETVSGHASPLVMEEKALGFSAIRTEFDIYVPGLLIAAIVMILFSASITIAREVEGGTARRLLMTSMSSFDFLGGITLVYLIISLLSVIITFSMAVCLGFHAYGSLFLAGLICLLMAMSAVGAGIITACFSKTMARAAIIANVPLLLLLFLGGTIFPLPYPTLFTLWGHAFTFADILPTTHAVSAINKVLGLGSGLGDIWVELTAMLVLAALYFYGGGRLFKQLQMK